ncbi:23S rRNA (uracil(1939)-C(5))-methyltransferase RlmD [Idiomarina tyrosinivorans]|uniref:23S rRNA (Uracil(1939)-C(5))-methyltransferase RlmD n=1 Tax=Idiomarina tyrosinivorans TaxID=1445662 RepID=A0A432ZRR6_9GAMM|nr:23S rRNA (uracil(1939)-C(5))-methyltransferase RlmD [Idiomarina tyrosinivorans]RUO80600.1 23S rRNA (uracil(1939)-C(5))-methyltransferase RlmD [Idiomarina tyrosinivorans]
MAQFFKPSRRAKPQPQQRHQMAQVIALDHQARGIVRTPEVRFIEGVLPGERIRFAPQGKYDGILIERLCSAEQRQTPPCQYYQTCGGCDFQHASMSLQRRHKQQVVSELFNKFAQLQQLPWQTMVAAQESGYRRRVRLATHWHAKRQQLTIGLRQRHSKKIVSIDQCWVCEPAINDHLPKLAALIENVGLGRQLGHVDILAVQPYPLILLRIDGVVSDSQRQDLTQWQTQHSVQIALDDGQAQPQLLVETQQKPYVRSIDGDPLYLTPGDFFQVNAMVNQQLVERALAWLAPNSNDTVMDLYAGIGNFSLPLARRCHQLVAVEGITRMTAQLSRNASAAGLSNIDAKTLDLLQPQALQQLSFAVDAVLLDPARAGAKVVAEKLAGLPKGQRPQRIVYVSCAADTLARDVAALTQGNYRISRCAVVDMFPQTHHIETIMLLEESE